MTHAYQLHEFFLSEIPDLTGKRVLECGCGYGVWGYLVRSEKNGNDAYLVGFDLHKPYVEYCKFHRIYHDVILTDARYLPFKRKSFDVVMASELVEHLEREDGEIFLNRVDEICREVAIISTPNGYTPEGHLAEESKLEAHRSEWFVSDFKQRGYKLHGIGLRYSWIFYGGERRKTSSYVFAFLRYIFTPLSYVIPRLGWILIANKRFTLAKIKY